MTWCNVLSTQEIKQDGAKTANLLGLTLPAERITVKNEERDTLPKCFMGYYCQYVTHLPGLRYSGGVKAKLVLQGYHPTKLAHSQNTKGLMLLYERSEKQLMRTSKDLPHQRQPCMHADHDRVPSLCYCSSPTPVPHKAQPSSSLPNPMDLSPLTHITTMRIKCSYRLF